MDTDHDRLDLDALRARLVERHEALLAGDATRREAADTVELDQQRNGRLTRMDALQGQAMARARNERARNEITRIEAALKRLDAGTYGDCLRCEEPIDPRRLNADPAAVLCIDCAEASSGSR
ncbi:MAG: TraR/DksA C4-type zinc finger protein [Arhodomonas sp.]|nr:TraR/DksA C4-type zinc finger protein [Arhodomonas sp.]